MNTKLNIHATVYDMFGSPASGVFAWPEGRPQDQTYIISNGELIMTGVNYNDIIVFKYFDKIIAKVPANQIGTSVEIDTTVEFDEVVITNKPKKSNLLLKILGAVGVLGLGYAVLSDDSQKVDL